jgi:hypothetical protein
MMSLAGIVSTDSMGQNMENLCFIRTIHEDSGCFSAIIQEENLIPSNKLYIQIRAYVSPDRNKESSRVL